MTRTRYIWPTVVLLVVVLAVAPTRAAAQRSGKSQLRKRIQSSASDVKKKTTRAPRVISGELTKIMDSLEEEMSKFTAIQLARVDLLISVRRLKALEARESSGELVPFQKLEALNDYNKAQEEYRKYFGAYADMTNVKDDEVFDITKKDFASLKGLIKDQLTKLLPIRAKAPLISSIVWLMANNATMPAILDTPESHLILQRLYTGNDLAVLMYSYGVEETDGVPTTKRYLINEHIREKLDTEMGMLKSLRSVAETGCEADSIDVKTKFRSCISIIFVKERMKAIVDFQAEISRVFTRIR